MLPLVGGLMSGAASLLGGYFSSQTSAANTQANIQAQQQAQSQAEQFNAGQAQVARDYSTQMSNTAYQRASADMEKAGLNPMMMFGSGGAASTPSSPSPSVGTPNMALSSRSSPLGGLGESVNRALNSAIDAKALDKMTEEIANLRTARGLTVAQTGATTSEADLLRARAGETRQTVALRGPAEQEAQGVENLGSEMLKKVGAVKYLAGSAGDVLAPIISSATGVGRIGQAFSDIAGSKLQRQINRGNFVGKYGQPVDEYLANP